MHHRLFSTLCQHTGGSHCQTLLTTHFLKELNFLQMCFQNQNSLHVTFTSRWFRNYCNVKWSIADWWLLPGNGIGTMSICYQLGYPAKLLKYALIVKEIQRENIAQVGHKPCRVLFIFFLQQIMVQCTFYKSLPTNATVLYLGFKSLRYIWKKRCILTKGKKIKKNKQQGFTYSGIYFGI